MIKKLTITLILFIGLTSNLLKASGGGGSGGGGAKETREETEVYSAQSGQSLTDFLKQHYIFERYLQAPEPSKPHKPVLIKMKHKKSGRTCAIKLMERQSFRKEELNIPQHPSLSKTSVVVPKQIARDNKVIVLKMPFSSGGDLYTYITESPLLPVTEVLEILIPVLKTLQTMHKYRMVHLDIKLENILLSYKYTHELSKKALSEGPLPSETEEAMQQKLGFLARLTDFGSAIVLFGHRDRYVHTTSGYEAPEYFLTQNTSSITAKYDIWSIGNMMYLMLTKHKMCSYKIDGRETCRRQLRAIRKPQFMDKVKPQKLRTIVRACLSEDPSGRPTARELTTQLEELLSELTVPVEATAPTSCNTEAETET